MNGISAVGVASGGAMTARPNPIIQASTQAAPAAKAAPGGQSTPADQLTPVSGQRAVSELAATGSQTVVSASSMSVKQSSEMLMVSEGVGGSITSDELLGAVLLLLILEYMQSEDEDEKKGLLNLVLAIAQQPQQDSDNGGFLMYNSTSQSIESTRFQMVSTENVVSAYSAGAGDPQQASPDGLGAAGLDASA